VKPFDLFSNAVRAKEIATILIRNGFADLLQKLEPPAWLVDRLVDHQAVKLNTWQRIRLVLEELGPIYVKFGQILSMRPDALPEPLIMELRGLQDRVTPVSFEEMEPVLIEALSGDIDSVFCESDKESDASASLAQVYFGKLRGSGKAVAVKIQRPHIRKTIGPDFEILEWFARQAHERLEDMRPYNLPGIVNELREGMERELDFRVEVRNTALFLLQNPNPEETFAPAIFEDLSTGTVIIMERIDGRKLEKLVSGSV
jgi:ubiquinone biosynthesis protein